MAREHRIISALAPTEVPVPPALGLCTDESVNGVPFYVMAFVEGSIVFDRSDGRAVDESLRPAMTASLVETLAALHTLVPDETGLGDLGRREDYCARQLRRWKREIEDGSERDLPLVHELHDAMTAAIPPQQGSGIVHGDYRMDNCMMAADGSVAAVLDWELCTLGDVLADLAGIIMWWRDDSEAAWRLGDVPTSADGFGTSDEMVALYDAASDRDLSDLPWVRRVPVLAPRVHRRGGRVRVLAGAMGDETDADVTEVEGAIEYMLDRSRSILASL